MSALLYVLVGLVSGVFGGLFGLGGGLIMIPAMVFLFKMSQHTAQGTTLAIMVPPIGLLAAWEYYNKGYVDLKVAAFVCLGFFIGGLLGAKLAVNINQVLLSKLFGVMLLVISIRMILGK